MALFPVPPPEYSSSAPCPTYSPSPRPTERTVQYSARRPPPPSGIYMKRLGDVTVLVLNQEEEDAEHPSLGVGRLLAGSVLVENPNVKSVLLKIKGLVELAPISPAYLPFPVLETTKILYSGGPSTASSHNFPFEYSFPRTFLHDTGRCSLPPTFGMPFGRGLFVRCSYRVTVTVSSTRRHASFLNKNENVSFQLDYRPRSRPSQPMILSPSLFDTIKYCPEEWKQLESIVSAPSKSPLMCDLFAPSRGVFCVDEVIPFHLQLSGAAACFSHISRFFMGTTAHPGLRVYMRRQISVDLGCGKTIKEINLGEGTLRLLGAHDSKGKGYLNWEGQVQCGDPKSVVASFECGHVSIQDALVVEMIPPHECAFKRTVFEYRIKLATDRWDAGEWQQ